MKETGMESLTRRDSRVIDVEGCSDVEGEWEGE